MPKARHLFVLLLTLAGLTGCTWVSLDTDAVAVQLVPASAVEGCTKVGKTTSATRAKIGPWERDHKKVAQELLTLARNSAASMGGNTLVSQSPIRDGKQAFAVYDCKR